MMHDRMVSLDAFRGAAIAAMILVNNPGRWSKAYPALRHAQWNGWTLADCVFPLFLFIVGVAVVFSLAKHKESTDHDTKTVLRILRRTGILFGLGLLLNGFPEYDLSDLRIPGVLQRIAICYLAASLIILKTRIITQAWIVVGLLVSYWLMLEFIPVPGVGAGILEPGKNLPSYVDGLLLQGHLWYNIRPYDPEGLLSTIPAISTTLLGVLTGHWLRSSSLAGRQSDGHAARRGFVAHRRTGLEYLASDQQGDLDPFLRSFHGWNGPRLPDRLFLGDRCKGAEKGGNPVSHFRDERHCRLCALGVPFKDHQGG